MSDDDRDIDIESDVSILLIYLFIIFKRTKQKKNFFLTTPKIRFCLQDENDSDTRSQNRSSTNGTQFFSQVRKMKR